MLRPNGSSRAACQRVLPSAVAKRVLHDSFVFSTPLKPGGCCSERLNAAIPACSRTFSLFLLKTDFHRLGVFRDRSHIILALSSAGWECVRNCDYLEAIENGHT